MSETYKTDAAIKWPSAVWLAIAFAALMLRHYVLASADVAWYLTIVEKWLDGQRLYIDLLENNPPFSIWLYAPFVVVARLTHIRAETCLDFGMIGLAAASVRTSAWIVGGKQQRRHWLEAVTFAVLVLLPAATFGQREHFALVFFLPVLAAAICRAEDRDVSVNRFVVAGVAAGVVLCIKPHFAAAIACVALAAAVMRRDWRPLLAPEYFIGGGIFCFYVACAFILYPAYWNEMLPLARLIYLPVRAPYLSMLNGWMLTTLVTMALVGLTVSRLPHAATLAFPRRLLASAAICGFFIAALVQGKGWPYHFYPAFGLIMIVVADVIADFDWSKRDERISFALVVATSGALLIQAAVCLTGGLDTRFIEAPLRALKASPRVISLAADIGVAFPVVRAIDGVWVGRASSVWVSDYAATMAARDNGDPARLAAYRAAEEKDRRQIATDIRLNNPDIILVQRRPDDYLNWANRDAELASLMQCFEPSGRHGIGEAETADGGFAFEIELYKRKTCSQVDAPAR